MAECLVPKGPVLHAYLQMPMHRSRLHREHIHNLMPNQIEYRTVVHGISMNHFGPAISDLFANSIWTPRLTHCHDLSKSLFLQLCCRHMALGSVQQQRFGYDARMNVRQDDRRFATTHRSLLVAAWPDAASQSQAEEALVELRQVYWYPFMPLCEIECTVPQMLRI